MDDPYSQERVVSFIESLPDETLLPPSTAEQVGLARVQENEQGEDSTLIGQPAEKQHDANEAWDNPAYFCPPDEAQECLTVRIHSESLRLLLKAMGKHEWTAEGLKWEERFLGGDDEDQKIWYRVHSKKIKTERCRRLLMFIHKLWFLCQETPSAYDIEQQASFIRRSEHVKKLRQLIHAIQTTVDKVCAKVHDDLFERPEERAHAANTAGSLRSQIIPLLLLTLKAAFMMGSQEQTRDRAQALPQEGILTPSTMKLMQQITDWIKKLHLAMVTELEANPPVSESVDVGTRRRESRETSKIHEQLKAPIRHIDGFEKSLTKAFNELAEVVNRPKRKREAMEEDERIRQKREDKRRMEEEAVQRRMALFRASAQTAYMGQPIQATPDYSARIIQEPGNYAQQPHPGFYPQMSPPLGQPQQHPGLQQQFEYPPQHVPQQVPQPYLQQYHQQQSHLGFPQQQQFQYYPPQIPQQHFQQYPQQQHHTVFPQQHLQQHLQEQSHASFPQKYAQQPHLGFHQQQPEHPHQQNWEANEGEFIQVSTSQGLSQSFPFSPHSHWEHSRQMSDSEQARQNILSNEVYQNKYWSYAESDILLTMIRMVPQPSLVDLAGKLPGRSEQEIMQKMGELKEMSRRRYEEWDMAPPQWCFT